MRSLFIPAYWEGDVVLSEEQLEELSKFDQISLFSAVNFLDQLPKVSEALSNKGVSVNLTKAKRAKVEGQLLGCDSYCESCNNAFSSKAILYVGDGSFHPDALLFSQIYTKKTPVYRLNPKEKKLELWSQDRIADKVKKIKANLLRFTLSETIGILVTLKHGQERLNDALKLKEKLESQGKTAYVFVDDTLNFAKIEDYNYIDCWVNTACPRIGQDDGVNIIKPIININEANDVNAYLACLDATNE